MADLELVDALTDSPPEIEPEIKRDFISSLEAEPYDDVIGEKFDKTDYVPLLDDDEANGSGNKQSAEGSRPSVVENGEHKTGSVGISDPFGRTGDEDVLVDVLLPPQVQICPAFTAQLPDVAFDEGWLTDSYSKSGETDTHSADASEKTSATCGETPSDESANLPFQVPQNDPTSHIWQPTAEEQIALGSHNAPEHEGLQLKPEESPFDAALSTESQLLPGLGSPYLEQHDGEDLLEPDPFNQDITSTSIENPDQTTENYVHESLDNTVFAEHSRDEAAIIFESVEGEQQKAIETEQVIATSQTSAEPPRSPASHLSAEPPVSPFELTEENSLVSPAEIQAKSLDLLVVEEASPVSAAASDQEKSPASPTELEQEAEISTSDFTFGLSLPGSASPDSSVSKAEALAFIDALVADIAAPISPIALDPKAKSQASPVALVQELEAPASPVALVQESEAPASLVALVQKSEVAASPVALIQAEDVPASLDAVTPEADAAASLVALAHDKVVLASLAALNQELEIPTPQKRTTLASPAPPIPAEAITEGIQPPEGAAEPLLRPLGEVDLPHPGEQGKSEAVVAPEDVRTGSDITAPPSKELPASPEKKVKASVAATPSKAATTAATPKSKPLGAPSPKKPVSATPTQPKKVSSPAPATLNNATPKRPLGSAAKTATPKDAKEAKSKSPVKTPDKKPLTTFASTPRPSAVKASPAAPKLSTSATTTGTSAPKPNLTPKRPTSLKNDAKAAEAKKTNSAKSPTDLSRPKSVPADLTKSNGAAPASTGLASSRPKTSKPAASKPLTGPSASTDAKKLPAARPAPLSKTSTAATAASKPSSAVAASKPSTVPKQPRPASAPDMKNVRSKIGSTDNLKYQPGGGKQAKVEKKPVPTSTARKPVPAPAASKPASTKPADSKETAQKQSNGKVTNAAKPSIGSSRPPAPASHKPVQILNKKVDVSKVSSKCGSKANAKAKPGSGDAKGDESLKTETTKQEPEESIKENGGEQITAPQNRDLATPTDNMAVDTRENGVEETLPVDGGNQREIQSFNTLIPETSI